jgi:hypothetical protein
VTELGDVSARVGEFVLHGRVIRIRRRRSLSLHVSSPIHRTISSSVKQMSSTVCEVRFIIQPKRSKLLATLGIGASTSSYQGERLGIRLSTFRGMASVSASVSWTMRGRVGEEVTRDGAKSRAGVVELYATSYSN